MRQPDKANRCLSSLSRWRCHTSRERWGTFSVRDHLRKQPFAADVLIYDRLVIPFPANPKQRDEWSKSKWAPRRLKSLLKVLRVEGDEFKRPAIAVPWDDHTRDLFRRRAETAEILDKEANYGLTRRLLATELAPPEPVGVTRVSIVAAYGSISDTQKDWIANDDQERRETVTIALANKFLVPSFEGKSAVELLQEAVDLADDSEFKKKRAKMYQWQEDVFRAKISDTKALQEMAQYVDEYNELTKKAVRTVYMKFAFTLVPIAISALSGPLAPAIGFGAIANLIRFWIYDRKPVIQADKCEAAAMFHTVHKELGWRTANI